MERRTEFDVFPDVKDIQAGVNSLNPRGNFGKNQKNILRGG